MGSPIEIALYVDAPVMSSVVVGGKAARTVQVFAVASQRAVLGHLA